MTFAILATGNVSRTTNTT